ncbi:MAG: YkgJ family cysteine cluster protein [Bdellovibrionales bacterium]|nr:YkgJ family cysteine cluster protein [Bdellovibrionales bacterium]
MAESKKQNFHHIFTIIDNMVDKVACDLTAQGETISCGKGCSHCCYLLVEISHEEATELAQWVLRQPQEKMDQFLDKIESSANDTRSMLLSKSEWAKFSNPWDYESDLPDEVYDEYFYGKSRPCPFLDGGSCAAYESRPTPCRLHMVTTDPSECSRESTDVTEHEVQDEIEELQDEAAPVISAMARDGRWGQLALLTYDVLCEHGAYAARSNRVKNAA